MDTYIAVKPILHMGTGASWSPGAVVPIHTVGKDLAKAWLDEGIVVKDEPTEETPVKEVAEPKKRGRPRKEVKNDSTTEA